MKSLIKKFIVFSISVFSLFCLAGCEETCPGIDFSVPIVSDTVSVPFDATLATQQRNVLLEDFTGVRCVNCPDGHLIAASILNSYPQGRVVVVAEHDTLGLLTGPYPFGHFDFRTTEAKDIISLLGGISSKPIGAIDRKIFTGETTIPVGRQKWPGYVAADIALSVPKVQMKIESQYNDATRVLSLGVILQYAESISGNNNLSIMLTESGMVEPQLDQTGIDTFYVHNHVLRDMISSSTGLPIKGNKSPGHATKYVMPDYTIPSSWNADSVHIVTFVTDTDSLNVLQVIDKTLK